MCPFKAFYPGLLVFSQRESPPSSLERRRQLSPCMGVETEAADNHGVAFPPRSRES